MSHEHDSLVYFLQKISYKSHTNTILFTAVRLRVVHHIVCVVKLPLIVKNISHEYRFSSKKRRQDTCSFDSSVLSWLMCLDFEHGT